jgi:hypothetical protein
MAESARQLLRPRGSEFEHETKADTGASFQIRDRTIRASRTGRAGQISRTAPNTIQTNHSSFDLGVYVLIQNARQYLFCWTSEKPN